MKRPSLSIGGLSAFRVALLAIAVALGLLVAANAFPSNPSKGVVTAPVASSKRSTPPPTHSPSPRPSPTPKVHGVVVRVLNGTTKIGLASDTTVALRSAGYKMRLPGDAASTTKTTIYYRADSRAEAQYLLQQHFPAARLKPAPSAFLTDAIQIVVILGLDYVTSPSPSP